MAPSVFHWISILPLLIHAVYIPPTTTASRAPHHPTAIPPKMKETDRCTTIIVGPAASLGGPMTTHTADCAECDFRLNKVPPKKNIPAGTLRPLYEYKGDYPATVSAYNGGRGKTWLPDNLEGSKEQKMKWGQSSKITGFIPEVILDPTRLILPLIKPVILLRCLTLSFVLRPLPLSGVIMRRGRGGRRREMTCTGDREGREDMERSPMMCKNHMRLLITPCR